MSQSRACALTPARPRPAPLLEQDVLSILELVAFDLFFGLDHIAGFGIDRLVADAIAGFPINDV
jgi:hypothetical protein